MNARIIKNFINITKIESQKLLKMQKTFEEKLLTLLVRFQIKNVQFY